MSFLKRHLPIFAQLEGYNRATARSDLAAGVTTAIMLVPQGMAYAMLAGLDPIIGLYVSTVPVILYAIFGTSRELAVGPVAMVSLLISAGIGPLVADGDTATYLSFVVLLALMVGLMQLFMGFANLGFLVKFLSHPVIAGFTSAAALVIGFSQLKHLLGIDIPRSHHLWEIIGGAIDQAENLNPIALLIGVVSIATLFVLKKFAPKVPRFLIVVAGGAVAVWALGLDHMGVSIVGNVPAELPTPKLPAVDLETVKELLPIALTISLVGFMESISVAQNFARQNGYEVDASQELKALGIANLGAALFQGYPVAGGFGRTAVNAQAGAKTGLAAMLTGVLIIITLLFLTPAFYYLPKSVLAAIIMTAVFGLIDIKEAKHLWHISKPDLVLMAVTFTATLTIGIEEGIIAGAGASLLWFVWKMSKPHVAVLGRLPGSDVYRNIGRYPDAKQDAGVVAVRVDAPLFFANTAFLKSTLLDLAGADAKHYIIDAKAIASLDSAGLSALEEIVEVLQRRGVSVWLAGVRGPVRDMLKAAQFHELLPEDHLVERVADAVARVAPAAPLECVA